MRESTKKGADARRNGTRRFGARIIGIVTAANRNDPSMWEALSGCEIAEFRADLFDPRRIPEEFLSFRADLDRRGLQAQTLLTIRLQQDGGSWPDAHAARREAVWEELGFTGRQPAADWLDIEIEAYPGMAAAFRNGVEASGVNLLLSHHDFQGCPPTDRLRELLSAMRVHAPAAVKFAVTCGDRAEAARLLSFAPECAAAAPSACLLAMGDAGRATRVLGPLLGCDLTYGYLSGKAVAPGQLSAEQLGRCLDDFSDSLDGDALLQPGMEAKLLAWAEARILGESLAE